MLGGLLLCWLGLLPLGALAVLDTNLGNQTIERVSACLCIFILKPAGWMREEGRAVTSRCESRRSLCGGRVSVCQRSLHSQAASISSDTGH